MRILHYKSLTFIFCNHKVLIIWLFSFLIEYEINTTVNSWVLQTPYSLCISCIFATQRVVHRQAAPASPAFKLSRWYASISEFWKHCSGTGDVDAAGLQTTFCLWSDSSDFKASGRYLTFPSETQTLKTTWKKYLPHIKCSYLYPYKWKKS